MTYEDYLRISSHYYSSYLFWTFVENHFSFSILLCVLTTLSTLSDTLNHLLSDGEYLFAYHDTDSYNKLRWLVNEYMVKEFYTQKH